MSSVSSGTVVPLSQTSLATLGFSRLPIACQTSRHVSNVHVKSLRKRPMHVQCSQYQQGVLQHEQQQESDAAASHDELIARLTLMRRYQGCHLISDHELPCRTLLRLQNARSCGAERAVRAGSADTGSPEGTHLHAQWATITS